MSPSPASGCRHHCLFPLLGSHAQYYKKCGGRQASKRSCIFACLSVSSPAPDTQLIVQTVTMEEGNECMKDAFLASLGVSHHTCPSRLENYLKPLREIQSICHISAQYEGLSVPGLLFFNLNSLHSFEFLILTI